jgi:hypothetical protein
MKRDRYTVHSGNPSQITWNRRTFVKGLGALAGSAAYLGYDVDEAAAEPTPGNNDAQGASLSRRLSSPAVHSR